MKRIVIYGCIFLGMFTANQVVAQEKVKVTDDKTKIKSDSSKVKVTDDKTKAKYDSSKVKVTDDKTKIKSDSSKVKVTDDKTKVKYDDSNVKVKDDKVKVKDGDYKEKYKDDKTKVKDGDNKIKIKDEKGMLPADPYTPTYSSNFVIGNPAHSKMILDMWKDWDDNAFDRHDYWADTVVVYLPDGTVTRGKAANIEGAKKYRSGLASAKSTIRAWVPLRSTDRNQNLVAIWGTETDTWPDGKVETNEIHEVWRINKDGKIDLMRQYTAKAAPQQ